MADHGGAVRAAQIARERRLHHHDHGDDDNESSSGDDAPPPLDPDAVYAKVRVSVRPAARTGIIWPGEQFRLTLSPQPRNVDRLTLPYALTLPSLLTQSPLSLLPLTQRDRFHLTQGTVEDILLTVISGKRSGSAATAGVLLLSPPPSQGPPAVCRLQHVPEDTRLAPAKPCTRGVVFLSAHERAAQTARLPAASSAPLHPTPDRHVHSPALLFGPARVQEEVCQAPFDAPLYRSVHTGRAPQPHATEISALCRLRSPARRPPRSLPGGQQLTASLRVFIARTYPHLAVLWLQQRDPSTAFLVSLRLALWGSS